MYFNQELLSVLNQNICLIRNRRQFAIHGSVAAYLNIVFRYCLYIKRTLSNSRLQTYRFMHDYHLPIFIRVFSYADLKGTDAHKPRAHLFVNQNANHKK